MSGWDFVFAGLELMTYNQARKAQQNLKEMKTSQEMAIAQMQLLEAMRNFIFDIARDIQLAEPNIQTYPQQVYIVANTLGWRLHNSGLTPELFPEFSDKDYVFRTQNKIVEIVGRCQQNLTRAQIQQADLAVKYVVEMPMLMQAIKAKWSFEQIQATQPKWDKISKENNARTSSGCLNVIGIVGVLFGVMVICSIGSGITGMLMSTTSNETIRNVISLPIQVITLLLMVIAFIAGVFFFGKRLWQILFGDKSDPDATPLRQKRDEWKQNLMPSNEWEQVKATFGGELSSEQFKKLYNERVALLEPLMGKDYVKTLLPGKQ